MDSWLMAAAAAVADTSGVPPDDLRLSDADETTLLDLARIAAHDSERTNAPLICYLAGIAVARSGKSLDDVAGSVPRSSD